MAAHWPQGLLQMQQLQDCSEPPFPRERVLRHRQEMCLPQLSSRMNQLEHSQSVTSAVLEELSMKDVTVENVFVTSAWQSGFSTKIRTDAKTLDFSFLVLSLPGQDCSMQVETCTSADSSREGIPHWPCINSVGHQAELLTGALGLGCPSQERLLGTCKGQWSVQELSVP